LTHETAGRSPHAIACVIFLVASLAVFGDVLLAGNSRILSMPNEDMTRPFFYWFPFGFDELKKGHLVLWNPHNYAGAAYFGGFGPALLYPPNWLHMVLPTAFAINVGIALHLFLAGVWVYLWTWHRCLHPAACILAGLIFMFCGAHFLQIYRGHLHCLTTLTWTPLIFLAIDGVLQTFSVTWILLGMAAVAMQILAGHVQYIFYTAIIAGIYALAGWLKSGARVREAAALASIYVGGASLAAVQLFTGLQAAAESHRTGISYGIASSFAFPPENLLTLILPGFFGDMVNTPYWGRWTLTEMSLFIGTAPFLLSVCGLVHGEKAVKRFSFTMALIVMILAVGDYTPLFKILYDHVPGFQNFRGTTKFTVLAALFIVMLVAVGFDHLLKARQAPRWLAAAGLVAGGVLIAAGALLVRDCNAGGGNLWTPALTRMRFLDDAYRDFVLTRGPASMRACVNAGRSLWIGGGTFLLLGLLLAAARRSHRLVYAIGIIGVVEVMGYARYTRPTFDPAPLVNRSVVLRRLLAENAAGESRLVSQDPYSYVAMGAGALDLWGADPTVLARYARFVALTQGWPLDAILVTSGFRTLSPLLGMLRLRYVLRIDREQVTLQPTHLKELPRALLVPHWKVLPTPENVLDALRDPTFDPERAVLLESDPGLVPAESDEPGQVSLRDVSTEVIEISADVPQPSILVITDNYSASWKATPLAGSDGRTYRVVPANSLLRAIPLTAGHHHLRLEYRPTALAVGAWVTMLSLVAYAAVGGLQVRKFLRNTVRERRSP
jgi:hypothetical protein